MIKREMGVTLVALVVMVIVIAILATVATYTGISTYKDMQVTAFTKRMQTVQEKVKSLKERAEVDSELSKKIGLSDDNTGLYGDEVSSTMINNVNSSIDSKYRYFSNDNVKKQLGLNDIEGSYIINFETLKVFSVEGVEYKGNVVHSLEEID